MPDVVVHVLEPAPGMRSRTVGLFLWQLDAQSRTLFEDLEGATPEELAWQPAPGMNTIGMLLAHVAVVEASWIDRALHGRDDLGPGVLPIGRKETGMPLPEGAPPPAFLEGKELSFHTALLEQSRAYTRRQLASVTEQDLDRRFHRRPANGRELEISVGWMLYHILEHEAGHAYQVNLLRHQYRVMRRS